MSSPTMPERFLEPERPTLSELAVGQSGLVMVTEIFVDTDRSTYLNPEALVFEVDAPETFKVRVEREPEGFVLHLSRIPYSFSANDLGDRGKAALLPVIRIVSGD